MNKRFLLVLSAIVVGLGLVYWFTKDDSSSPSTSVSTISVKPLGEGKTGVTLTEYGDFQCPACLQAEPLVQQVVQKYKKDIFFEFKNFPIPGHQNAVSSARTALAANLQGKFWEMHDILYQNQSTWSEVSNPYTVFESYAQNLGLDLAKFKQDFESGEVNDAINADKSAGQQLGVTGTPTFYLDGKKLDPTPTTLDEFSKLIDSAITAKK